MPDNDREEWPWEPVGPHIDLLTGYAFSSSRFTEDTNHVRLCRGINVTTGWVRWGRDITRRWPVDSPALQPFHLKLGDIVVGMDGSLVGHNYAMVTTEDMPSLLVQRVARLRAKDGLNQRYLFHFFSGDWFIRYSEEFKTSTAIPHITPDDIRRFRITRPSPDEQAAIAAILDGMDEAIRETEGVLAKLKQLKAGLLHDLLTLGLDDHGQLRDHARHPEQFQATPLGLLPTTWDIRPLCHVAQISSGVTLGRDLKGGWIATLPYLRVANVQDGFLDLSEIKTVSVPANEVVKYELHDGDILLTEGGDFDKLGRGTVWRGEIRHCLHQNHIFRVRPDREALLSDYLAAFTASSFARRYFLLSSKQSTNLASINSTQLKALPVICPPVDEQQQIINSIKSQDDRIRSEDESYRKLKLLKHGLAHDLLSGRVRVSLASVADSQGSGG